MDNTLIFIYPWIFSTAICPAEGTVQYIYMLIKAQIFYAFFPNYFIKIIRKENQSGYNIE